MQSWLAQGSSGGRVTLLPGTTFIHVNTPSDGREKATMSTVSAVLISLYIFVILDCEELKQEERNLPDALENSRGSHDDNNNNNNNNKSLSMQR